MHGTIKARDIITGELRDLPDPRALLRKEKSNDGEKNLALSQLGADLLSGRASLDADKIVRMNTGSGAIGIPDVSQGHSIGAFAPTQRDGFIADAIAPVSLVEEPNGFFFDEIDEDAIQFAEPVIAAPGAEPISCEPMFSPSSYRTTIWAVCCRLSRQLIGGADFDLPALVTARLVERLRLLRERRLAKLLLDASSWDASNVIASSVWNGASGAPVSDIQRARAKSSQVVNAAAFSEAAELAFHGHAQTAQWRMGGGELPPIHVARAKAGAKGSASYVWGSSADASAVLLRVPTRPTDRSTCRTIRWRGVGPSERVVDGVLVTTAEVPHYGSAGGVYVVAMLAEDVIVTDPSSGALITGILT